MPKQLVRPVNTIQATHRILLVFNVTVLAAAAPYSQDPGAASSAPFPGEWTHTYSPENPALPLRGSIALTNCERGGKRTATGPKRTPKPGQPAPTSPSSKCCRCSSASNTITDGYEKSLYSVNQPDNSGFSGLFLVHFTGTPRQPALVPESAQASSWPELQ